LDKYDAILANDNMPTFNISNSNYYEILDLFISSKDIYHHVKKFEVDDVNLSHKDHFPTRLELDFNIKFNELKTKNKLNFGMADWDKFKKNLSQKAEELSIVGPLSDLNKTITSVIIESVQSAIPLIKKNNYKSSFPPELINLIKLKRQVRKEIKKLKLMMITIK
jgi:hypothetical protein